LGSTPQAAGKCPRVKSIHWILFTYYNKDVNAKLLSKLYVSHYINGHEDIRNRYRELQARCSEIILFPIPNRIPENDSERIALEKKFLEKQVESLKMNSADIIAKYITKYDKFYTDLVNMNGDITKDMENLFNQMVDEMNLLGKPTYFAFGYPLLNILSEKKIVFSKMLECKDGGQYRQPKITFKDITYYPFTMLAQNIKKQLKKISNMKELNALESHINLFADKCHLINYTSSTKEKNRITFGIKSTSQKEKENNCMRIFMDEKYQKDKLFNYPNISKYVTKDNDIEFSGYRNLIKEKMNYEYVRKPLAIIMNENEKIVLLFYPSYMHYRKKLGFFSPKEISELTVLYKDISIKDGHLQLKKDYPLPENFGLNINVFYQMIKELASLNSEAEDIFWTNKIKQIIIQD